MTDPGRLPSATTFVVWAPRHRGTRSAWLAAELGIDPPHYFPAAGGRGLRAAPGKYPAQLARTIGHLLRHRPRAIFAQSPPSFAAWTAAAWSLATGAAVVVDAHSDAFERGIWTRPGWITRAVARRAAAILVTDDHWAAIVRSWGGRPILVPNVPTALAPGTPPPLDAARPNVAVVNTWAPDEPLRAVIDAAGRLPEVAFHITGRSDRVAELGRAALPPNVRFTGFLDEPAYLGLLAAADAVVCLTTRDHTMQNGAAEAMSLGTPVVTSGWPILRSYFSRGTVHVAHDPAAIADGIARLLAEHAAYRSAILALRDEHRARWTDTKRAIVDRVNETLRRPATDRAAEVLAEGDLHR